MSVRKPHKLKDEDWAEQLQNLHFIRNQEKESSKST
jgi:hypothetical protein